MNYGNLLGSSYDKLEGAVGRATKTLSTVRTVCLILVVLAAVAAALLIAKKIFDHFTKNKKIKIRGVRDTVLAAVALVAMIVLLLVPTANIFGINPDISDYIDTDEFKFSGYSITFGDKENISGLMSLVALYGETEVIGAISGVLIFFMLLTTLVTTLAIAGMASVINAYFSEEPIYKAGKKLCSRGIGLSILYFFACLIMYLIVNSEAEDVFTLSAYIAPIIAIALKIGYSYSASMISEDLQFVDSDEEKAAPVETVNASPAEPVAAPVANDALVELKKYKELLDNGLISEEDYEKKKAEYLNSISSNN